MNQLNIRYLKELTLLLNELVKYSLFKRANIIIK